jgi:hypothetical protein
MSALTDLQSDFQAYLLEGGDRMLARVTGTPKVSAETRLAIYYDAYRLRLLEALDSNYPVLHAWLGDAEFEKLGLAYLQANPSVHFSIRYFGHCLSDYLVGEEFRDRPYLAEMAVFEWAISEAFDSEDSAVKQVEDMGAVPPEAWPGMRLRLHASVQRLDLKWNVPIIWKAIRENLHTEVKADTCRGETSNMPSTSKGSRDEPASILDVPPPESSNHPQAWLVWRQDLKNYFRSLSVDEAWALDAVLDGETFASVCEGLCEWIDPQNVALHAARLTKHWITDGMVCGIELGKQ